MSYKVVRDSLGAVVAFGPNADSYQPTIGSGQTISVEESAPILPGSTPEDREAACQGYLNGGAGNIDERKLSRAKMISDLAFRLGKAPGALTPAELLAERNRIAAIYKNL